MKIEWKYRGNKEKMPIFQSLSWMFSSSWTEKSHKLRAAPSRTEWFSAQLGAARLWLEPARLVLCIIFIQFWSTRKTLLPPSSHNCIWKLNVTTSKFQKKNFHLDWSTTILDQSGKVKDKQKLDKYFSDQSWQRACILL